MYYILIIFSSYTRHILIIYSSYTHHIQIIISSFVFSPSLNGKLECTAMEDSLIINIKEIRVQGSLQHSRHHGNSFRGLAVTPAINPVQEVKGAVEAEAEEVVRGDGFGFSGFLELEHLWQDGD